VSHFYSIELKVMPDTEAEALKAGEVLNRAAAGLVMDGFTAELTYMRVERSEILEGD